ncbi:methyl-accepting chemotaxis protein [Noviherbaspirillum aridicola]|uniref:Methyl-accepting chemotaxis protein n=1 Tax=Noviherbaspirillum aridicola TaxID=2849687 RepID=A0ABQ4Q725_9BURK|nr:PAS domain-containing methyl-accepting chemotaxis protein [Noviherbaspirillum aridicola]GIZ52806.1 methyl-accepting chemotaxis protein [Noviherbaspirillum aridicola]
MRVNHPVTGNEYRMRPDQSLISRTDTRGVITYANRDFIEVSGYSEAELLGQPHNLIRHPDMPPEAFADMWAQLKAGRSWSGLVKNRRRNGDHYWVHANATPIWENGRVTGYTSVRTVPSREQVEAAEALYARFREDRARGLAIRHGQVVRTGLPGLLEALTRLSIARRVQLSVAVACACTLGVGLLGIRHADAADAAWLWAAMGAGVVFNVLLGVMLVRAVTRPLAHAVDVACQIAACNLTAPIDIGSRDETGQILHALATMKTSLANIVAGVRRNAQGIASGAAEIAAGNIDLSSRTEDQAASLEESAASMQQMIGTVRNNAEHAANARALVDRAQNIAVEGGAAMNQVVAAMEAIAQSSRRISDITGVIDGIAFQTNLLALNAAVEAARAGEQGRGFAVVAMEVRSLAARSAEASREITRLIKDAARQVEAGSAEVVHARQTMDGIVASVEQVAGMMGEITAASNEQNRGIAQLSETVMRMDQVTQQNAALAEQAAAASAALQTQGVELMQEFGVFRLDDAHGAAVQSARVIPLHGRRPAAADGGAAGIVAHARQKRLPA